MSKESDAIVLFVIFSILFGIASLEIKKLAHVPVPCSLLIIGILLRIISSYTNFFNLNSLGNVIDGTSPDVVMYVIVPSIIFQGAFSTEWSKFKKELGQIFIMSSPVVILSSFLLSVIIKYVLDYNLNWSQSIQLGIVLCATDHATTRDIMKNIHMDTNFNSLLDGETILNQNTVITLFFILIGSDSAVDQYLLSIGIFLKKSGVGFMTGIGFSYVMGKVLRRIVNDELQEINLSLVTTFLLFWVSQFLLDSSGVMSVVTYGLYMSAYGKILISPAIQKNLKHLWIMISSSCEGLIFFMGGMILGKYFISNQSISYADIYKLLFIYISQLTIRLIVIVLHSPFLYKLGYGISFPKIIILSLGGIKGVISTALAIIAANSSQSQDDFRGKILFFSIGITIMTIVLNPILLRAAKAKLRIENQGDVQENLLLSVTNALLQVAYKKLEKLEKSKEFPLVMWNEVIEIFGPRELVISIIKRSPIGRKILKKYPDDPTERLITRFCDRCIINDNDFLLEMRRRFYKSLKNIYWHEFETGQCLGETSLLLISVTSLIQNQEKESMQDWKMIEKKVYNKKCHRFLQKLFENHFTSSISRKIVYDMIIKAYDTGSTFIKAHKKARELFSNMEIDEVILEQIRFESKKQEKICQDFLTVHIMEYYPEVISEVQSKMASFKLLISQRKLINKIYEQGLIKKLEYSYLLTAIDSNFKTLTFLVSPKIPPLKEILKNRFKKISEIEMAQLLPSTKELHLKPGSMIFEESQEVDGAYLILTGKVHEYSNWIDQELHTGNILGVQHLLPNLNQINSTSALALTVVTAVRLPKLIINFECVEEEIYKEAADEFIILNKEKFNVKNANNDHIIFVVGKSYIKKVYEGSLINLTRGGLVIKGKVRSDKSCFSLLRPTRTKIESVDNALILLFPRHFSRSLKNNRNLSDAFAEYYIKNAKKKPKLKELFLLKPPKSKKSYKIKLGGPKNKKSPQESKSIDRLLEIQDL
jgi:NhaP-type Na+/H+ or K+/H+ antiporter